MKKALIVAICVAVIFTFTFSGVFAGASHQVNDTLAEAYLDEALEAVDGSGSNPDGVWISDTDVVASETAGYYNVTYDTLVAYRADLLEAAKDWANAQNPVTYIGSDEHDIVELLKWTMDATNADKTDSEDLCETLINAQKSADTVMLTAEMITVSDLTYTGTVQTPTVKVADANTTYEKGTDYTLTYKDTNKAEGSQDVQNFKNVSTDKYRVVVTPKEGGKLTGDAVGVGFKLNPIELSNTGVTDTDKKVTYSVTSNIADTYSKDATVLYSACGVKLYYGGYADTALFNDSNVKVTVTAVNSEMKTATLTIEGQDNGNLTGSITGIEVKQATGLTAGNTTVVPKSTKTYNGVAQNVELTVTYTGVTPNKILTQGTDYTVTPLKVTDAGNVTLTITGKGNYAGTFDETVEYLRPKKTSNSSTNNITVTTLPSQVQNATPAVKVTDVIDGKTTELKMGTDYGLAIDTTTVGKGTGSMTVDFKGNYEGQRTQTFDVVEAGYDIYNATIKTSGTYSYDYDGSSHTISYVDVTAIDPDTEKMVTLKEGTDYTVSYRYTDTDGKVQTTTSPTNAGTYTLLITGKGSWGSEQEGKSLTINKYKVSNCMVSVSVTSATKKPSVTVKGNGVTFTENTDYTIDWYTSSNNTTMYVTVSAVSEGNLSGSVKKTCSVGSARNFKITGTSVYSEAGEEITVVLEVTENTGITSLQLKMDYDEDVLEFVSAENGVIFTGTDITGEDVFISPGTDSGDSKVLQWIDGTATSDITATGKLVTLKFKVKDDIETGKTTTINFTCDSSKMQAIDVYGQNVDVMVPTVTVNIIDFKYGDVNGDEKVDIADVIQLRRYLAEWTDYNVYEKAAELDGDGIVSLRDVTILERYIANWAKYENIPVLAETLPTV